jgi:hypothetical protein
MPIDPLVVSATPTPTNTLTPTLTLTPTVEPTATPETPAQPSVASGLREENAVGGPVFDSGTKTWVTKNKDGNVTATWNTETKSWVYSPENITVDYVQIGIKVDQKDLAPFMGPLPPDDPSTHFKDPNTRDYVMNYGIGPEAILKGTAGSETPVTLIVARFRGVIPIDPTSKSKRMASIFEIPRSPDTSVIAVIRGDIKYFGISGTPDDTFLWDQMTEVSGDSFIRETGMQKANDQLVGHMVMFSVQHDKAILSKDSPSYESIIIQDTYAQAFFDYITGKSTNIPLFDMRDGNTSCFNADLIVPASQLPK